MQINKEGRKFNSVALLIGFELNVSIKDAKQADSGVNQAKLPLHGNSQKNNYF